VKCYRALSIMFLALIGLAGCDSNPSGVHAAAKPAPKPTEALTGREAFQKVYVQARGWAPDAKPVRLESATTSDSGGQDGKSALWRGYFASPSRRSIKSYIWSGSSAEENARDRGVTARPEDTWSPNNSSAYAFELAYLKIDSGKAWEIAQQHGGEKLLQADPKQPVQYTLAWNTLTNELVWHVVYGTSVNSAKLRVAVNASDGKFIRVER
jgi:hypothetical protein